MLCRQVVIYHGGKRTGDPSELAAADVVLTTYSIVENEFRKNCLPGKVPCRYCNTKMYPDRLRIHLKCALLYESHCLYVHVLGSLTRIKP